MEFADISTGALAGLVATGAQIGVDPEPYSLRYRLIHDALGLPERFCATSRTLRWHRRVAIDYHEGAWTVERESVGIGGGEELPEPAFDQLDGAHDLDLGYSPVLNSTPVLRDRLLDEGAEARDYLMAWVSVPDLTVTPSRQRYEPLGADGARRVVRYSNLDSDYTAKIWFDADGFVTEYEGFLRRIAEARHAAEPESA
jgi:uncharacterized protein